MKFFLFSLLLFPLISSAATDPLFEIYAQRIDLQKSFDETGVAIAGSAAGFLIDLEDWARQYGWQEYNELAVYAPSVDPPSNSSTPAPSVTASHYIVIDKASGAVLAQKDAGAVWPIASITKLMTTDLLLNSGVNLDAIVSVRSIDDVGGAKLWVNDGTTFSVRDLLAAMLIGSANNAANALSRITAGNDVVDEMNARAEELGLHRTTFVDPAGIDPANISTAREVAELAKTVFAHEEVHQLTTTSSKYIYAISDGQWRRMKNTNWLVYYPEYDDVWVTAGKTGYLDESGWNLVVQMRPSKVDENREVIVVTFGSTSRQESFNDTEALAQWAWESFDWDRGALEVATR
ncbi:MAG: serine hydrolase [Patescibacteria group bacterium]